jgi:bifunctional DNA-binding transcriptional regulator/antitoxin component of YhaV-PrlF toxin-antitoxin module
MSLVKLGKRRLVVIPQQFCDQLGIEVGDFFEVQIEGEKLVMVPKKVVDATALRVSHNNIFLKSECKNS